MSQLRVENYVLEFCMAGLSSEVSQKAHCIARAGSQFLDSILQTTQCRAAMWGGNAPLVDTNGDTLVNEDLLTRFKSWDLAPNQSWLRSQGAFAILAQFSAIIPADTPTNLVSKMYSDVKRKEVYDFFSTIV